MLKKTLRWLGAFLLVVMLYLAGVLLYGTLTDWQPTEEEVVQLTQPATETMITDSVLSFAIWNVGYGGLGEESDFFFEKGGGMLTAGGRMIRPSQDLVAKNIAGMRLFVESTPADFYLLQEVDYASRRSYFTNQFDTLRALRPDHAAAFAANYRVRRVPIPLLQPWSAYGPVHSGLATLSRWQPTSSTRVPLPGSFGWPTRIFQLDRCLLVSRFPTATGPELVVINAHLSAYDSDGSLKAEQMKFLREYVLAEYEAGHYVIVGGDWNQCPPYFPFDTFSPGNTQGYTQLNISADYLPEGWRWLYDATTPTNRKVNQPYEQGISFTTLIDFYLISPNLQARRVKTINQGFQFSDHQPIYFEVELGQ
jgi:endonuclease/exonuclease/phosphatase family metal-dependent hydrolase